MDAICRKEAVVFVVAANGTIVCLRSFQPGPPLPYLKWRADLAFQTTGRARQGGRSLLVADLCMDNSNMIQWTYTNTMY